MKVLFFALIVLAITGCGDSDSDVPVPSEKDIAARVGDTVILVSEVESELDRLGHASSEARESVLNALIERRLCVLEAQAQGWDSDAQMKKDIERLVVRRVRQERDARLQQESDVSSDDVLKYYKNHIDDFSTPQMARGAILFKRGEPKEAAQVLEGARDQALQLPGEAFGSLAEEYSDDSSTRRNEGRMFWVSEEQASSSRWGEEVIRVLLALEEPGEISPVVSLADGAVLLRLIEKRPAIPKPLNQVRGEIVSILQQKRRDELLQDYRVSLEERFEVVR